MSQIESHHHLEMHECAKLNWRSRLNAAALYNVRLRDEPNDSVARDFESDLLEEPARRRHREKNPERPRLPQLKARPGQAQSLARSADRFDALWTHWDMEDSLYGEQIRKGKPCPETEGLAEPDCEIPCNEPLLEPQPPHSTPLPAFWGVNVRLDKRINALIDEGN